MFPTKRIAIAAAIGCLCTPVAGQARPLDERPHQDLRGADARGAPATADEFPSPTPAPQRVRIVEVPSPGVDWGDAGIGAGGALVVVLLATATGMTVTRRRAAA